MAKNTPIRAHLELQVAEAAPPWAWRGGRFVNVERAPPGSATLDVNRYDHVTRLLDENHVGLGADGIRMAPISHRLVLPSEPDLMARPVERSGGWRGEPFTASSPFHVSVHARARPLSSASHRVRRRPSLCPHTHEEDSDVVGIRRQRQERTREALLDAAATVFASYGYSATSIPRIAHEARMSTGAIYSNFSGKQELFLAVVRRVVEAGAASRRHHADVTADHDELIARMVTNWTSTIETAPDIVLLMAEFWLYALRHPPLEEAVARLLADVRANLLTNIVDAGVVADPDVAERLAGAVQAMAYGYAMQRLVDANAVSPDRLVESVGWLLRGAVPPAQGVVAGSTSQ